jgi:hypothetical protein
MVYSYELRYPTPPCLEDTFNSVDGKVPGTTSVEDEEHLGAAKLEFQGLHNGTFGCPRWMCGRMGKLFFYYPNYQVTQWPECPLAKKPDNA